jgi:flagellar hook-associated protein 3 FlgL
MRISTSMLFDMGVASIQQQTSDLIKTNQQIASGRRILSPSDDPVAAARVLEVSQSQALNKQFDVNTGTAISQLGLEDSILGSIGNLIQNAQTTAVYAGNAALSDTDRASLAMELRSNYQELLGLANSTDGSGQYMFSGYKGATRPFGEMAPGVVAYSGDEGQRLIQISPSRQLAVSDSGSSVFQQIKNGNGTFVSRAATANTGAGIVDPGTVSDPAKWEAGSKDYSIRFAANTDVKAGSNSGTAAIAATIGDAAAWAASGSGLKIAVAAGAVANTYDYTITDLAVPPHSFTFNYDTALAPVTVNLDGTLGTINAGISLDLTGVPVAGDGFRIAANAVVVASPASPKANAVGAAVTAGIVDQAAWNAGGKSLLVSFAAAAAPTLDYTITDTVSGVSVTGNYTPGTPLTHNFEGADIVLSGTPVAGDSFAVSPSAKAGWTYDIIDNKTNTSLLGTPASSSSWSSSWRTYTSGQAISLTNQGTEPVFDFGVSTKVEGNPAGGDQFTLKASQNEDLFATLHNLITALEAGSSNPVTAARYQNDLNLAMTSLSNAQVSVLTVRAAVGSRWKEVESVKSTGEDLQLQYQQTISSLQDLDYAQAITDLTRQKATLEAAQQSFVKIQALSLFNYI